jgi:hypothetical protein
MGGTGMPLPTQQYVNAVNNLFIQPNQMGAIPQKFFTPEQLYPVTGVRSLLLQTSVNQGISNLDSQITQQLGAGSHVTVFGYSKAPSSARWKSTTSCLWAHRLRAPTNLISCSSGTR